MSPGLSDIEDEPPVRTRPGCGAVLGRTWVVALAAVLLVLSPLALFSLLPSGPLSSILSLLLPPLGLLVLLVEGVRQLVRRRWLRGLLCLLPVAIAVGLTVYAVVSAQRYLTRPRLWESVTGELPGGRGRLTFCVRPANPPMVPGIEKDWLLYYQRPGRPTVTLQPESYLEDYPVHVYTQKRNGRDLLETRAQYSQQAFDETTGERVEEVPEKPGTYLGSFYRNWGPPRWAPFRAEPSLQGGVDQPRALAVSPAGDLVVVELASGTVLSFDLGGKFRARWRAEEWPWEWCLDLAFAPDGTVFYLHGAADTLRRYDTHGRELSAQKCYSRPSPDAQGPLIMGLVVRPDSTVCLWERYGTVFPLTAEGKLRTGVPLAGKPDLISLAAAPDGTYVGLVRHRRPLQRWSAQGRLLSRTRLQTRQPFGFFVGYATPCDLCADQRGHIFVAVWKGETLFLEQFGPRGEPLGCRTTQLVTPRRLTMPDVSLAADARGYLYVTDEAGRSVRKFPTW